MKISRRLILKVAYELIEKQGRTTQIEIQDEIEKRLGRSLTHGEKIRVTRILKNELCVDGMERDKDNGFRRIYIFL